MSRKRDITMVQDIRQKIKEAQRELRLAELEESTVDPEFLDIAIERVDLAKANLNALYKRAKIIFEYE